MTASQKNHRPENLLGRTIAQYRVERIVGRGGMGTVYEAVEPTLDRKVALKVLSLEASTDRESVDRFKREAKVLARIEHPNVVQIYQMGRVGSVIFIAQEFVEGTDYETIVEDSGPLDLGAALEVLDAVASALQAVHDVGVIHRDLKPSNVMRRLDGRVKVLDFGIAKPIARNLGPDITRAGMFLGTLGYCSPEQIRGEKLSVRSDLYSLGVMFYYFLTGEVPGKGAETEEMVQATLAGRLIPIRQRRADLADPVARLVEEMIHRDASRRPESTAVVRARIAEIREFLAATPAAVESASPPRARGIRRLLRGLFRRRAGRARL
ncbi:MAG: serine/threonine protein kinase [Planctomycetes bacterium]|nr:serine/threonine protein kinase [Planctomycetota bacterium]